MKRSLSSLRKLVRTRQQFKTVTLLCCAYLLLVITGLLFKFLTT